MTFKERIQNLNASMTGVHQIIITAGLILGALYAGYVSFADKIVESHSEQVSEALSQNIEKMGILTEKRYAEKMDTVVQAQTEAFAQLISLHESHMKSLESVEGAIFKVRYSLDDLDKRVSELSRMINKAENNLKSGQADTQEVIKQRAYTDSLQNVLNKVLIEKSSREHLEELRMYHDQEMNQIKRALIDEYPAKVKRTPKGIKMMTHQKGKFKLFKSND